MMDSKQTRFSVGVLLGICVIMGYMIHTFKSNMVYKNQPITKKADNRRHITKPTIKKNIEQGNDNKPKMYIHSSPNITMEQRTKLTKRVCDELWKPVPLDKLTPADMPPKLLVSDHYKVYYCKAAKVGGTNLQRIFYVLNGLTNDTDTGNIKTSVARKRTGEFFARNRPNFVKKVLPRLKSYTSFQFVRHPLERVVSAYRDNKPNGIFRKFRMNGTIPTFNQYVDILLDSKSLNKPNQPIYKLCNPCRLKYDFIASLDNYDNDITTILKAIGAEKAVTIPKREETGYKQQKSSQVVENFYKDVPIYKISKLETLYELDYLLFGFEKFYK